MTIIKMHTEKLLLRPEEAFEVIAVSRATGYRLIESGQLPSIKVGRLVRIPVDKLKTWIEQKLAENKGS
ncbi:MAG: excisionase family DNA-binding protein [Blastocatellia bacterium]